MKQENTSEGHLSQKNGQKILSNRKDFFSLDFAEEQNIFTAWLENQSLAFSEATIRKLSAITIFSILLTLNAINIVARTDFPLNNNVQNQVLPSFGILAGFQENFHSAAFKELPTIFRCGTDYKSGNGSSGLIGGYYQLPYSPKLSFQFRGTYSSLSGTLTAQENSRVGVQQPVDATIENRLNSQISALNFEPTALYYPFDFPLAIKGGLNLSVILTNQYDQKEVLVAPNYATFTNGKTTRNESNGFIPGMNSLGLSFIFGMVYDLPFGKDLHLRPEVSYNSNLTNVAQSVSWNINSLRISASVAIPLYPTPPPPPEPEPPQPPMPIIVAKTVPVPKIEPPKPMLMADVEVVGVFENNRREKNFTITIEETEFRETLPLLPLVFFPENNSDLTKSRLNLLDSKQTAGFNESDLPTEAIQFYKNTLNIIGKRLRENPKANITVSGMIASFGSEKNNDEIAKDRATIVKDYLVKTWEIEADRIKVKTANLRKNPDESSSDDYLEECRRVEINSSNYEVMKPVLITKNSRTVSPPTIEFLSEIRADAGVDTWNVNMLHDANAIAPLESKDASHILQWHTKSGDFTRSESPVQIAMNVEDNVGGRVSISKQIPVSQITIEKKRAANEKDKRIEKFSLILFNFDAANVAGKDRKTLDEIKSRIHQNSTVHIVGYADRIGSQEHNKTLAEGRCKEVMRYLSGITDADKIGYQAVGSDELLYDNNIPEGRSYTRTVQIIIETPVDEK